MIAPNSFYDAIAARALAQVIDGSESLSQKQLRFMVRVPAGPTATVWLGLVKAVLVAARRSGVPWTIDISKHHFVTPEEDLRWGWRIIVQGPELQNHLESLAIIVTNAPVVAAQVEEVKLHGSPNRRVGGLMGHVQVGAGALLSRNS